MPETLFSLIGFVISLVIHICLSSFLVPIFLRSRLISWAFKKGLFFSFLFLIFISFFCLWLSYLRSLTDASPLTPHFSQLAWVKSSKFDFCKGITGNKVNMLDMSTQTRFVLSSVNILEIWEPLKQIFSPFGKEGADQTCPSLRSAGQAGSTQQPDVCCWHHR